MTKILNTAGSLTLTCQLKFDLKFDLEPPFLFSTRVHKIKQSLSLQETHKVLQRRAFVFTLAKGNFMATLDSSSNLSSVTFLPFNESTKPEEVRVNLHYSSESMALQAKSFSQLKTMDTQDGSKVLLLLFPFKTPCSFCIVFTRRK